MSVNYNHVASLMEQVGEAPPESVLQTNIAKLKKYVAAGKTLRDRRTGEAISIETLGEVVRMLEDRIKGNVLPFTMEKADAKAVAQTSGRAAAEAKADPTAWHTT